MGFGNHAGTWTTIAGASLLLLAATFGGLLAFDYRGRTRASSRIEARYYAGRLRRRGAVVGLLALIGAAMIASTRIDALAGLAEARLWAWTWIGILLGAFAMLVLAGLDWFANRAFARDRGLELIEEHRETLAEVYARARGPRNPEPPPPERETRKPQS